MAASTGHFLSISHFRASFVLQVFVFLFDFERSTGKTVFIMVIALVFCDCRSVIVGGEGLLASLAQIDIWNSAPCWHFLRWRAERKHSLFILFAIHYNDGPFCNWTVRMFRLRPPFVMIIIRFAAILLITELLSYASDCFTSVCPTRMSSKNIRLN